MVQNKLFKKAHKDKLANVLDELTQQVPRYYQEGLYIFSFNLKPVNWPPSMAENFEELMAECELENERRNKRKRWFENGRPVIS